MKKWLLTRKFAYNNEPPPASPPVPPVPPPPPAVPSFTPEQQKVFNDALAVEKRKGEEKNNLLIQQIETLKKTGQMTKEQQEAANAQIEALRTEYMTKEQLAMDQHKKKETELSSTVKQTAEERDNWKNIFQTSLAETEILRAATHPETEAFSADQMLDFLRPKAKVVQVTDADGKPIPNKFAVRIPITVSDDKGVTKTIELEPQAALKQMIEMPQFFNLFKSKIKGGLGGNNTGGGGGGNDNAAEAIKDPEKWKEYRKKNGYAT